MNRLAIFYTQLKGSALLILGLFLLLAIAYSVGGPVMESSDELHHVPFAIHLSQGGKLPVQQPGVETLWNQEGSQPPLYYALGGSIVSFIDASDLASVRYINPHATIGQPLAPSGKNMIVHTDGEGFPWRGAVLAIHVMRLFSIALAAGTVLCTYGLARLLFPDRPNVAIGAMALTAFNPMFLFISASVNNDNLAILLSSLIIIALVQITQRVPAQRFLAVLGVLLGLAALTKLSALVLAPLTYLALAIGRFQTESPRSSRAWFALARDAALVTIPLVLIAGWWYVRNWQLYGDPTGLSAMVAIAGPRAATPGPAQLLGELQGFRMSYWGVFGGFNVLMQPGWVYHLLDALTLVAGLGLLIWAIRTRRSQQTVPWPALLLLATWICITFVALVRWTSMTPASQGRLMFPTITAMSLFMAIGLLEWLPIRLRPAATRVFCGLLFILASAVLFTSIIPAYRRPAPVVAQAPATARAVNYDYDETIRLLAFEVEDDSAHPGGYLPVTLYWQALQPVSEDLSVFVHLNGLESTMPLSQSDSYPVDGSYPTSWWKPGEIVRDQILVPVDPDVAGPRPVWMSAGLYRLKTGENLIARNTGGQEVFPLLSKLQIESEMPTFKPAFSLDATIDSAVRLIGYDLADNVIRPGDEISFTLYWEAVKAMDKDYKVFVHLVGDNETIVAQGDSMPTSDFYPTSQWLKGEIINDTYRLITPTTIPVGRYRVFVGLYDPSTGQRLPTVDAHGQSSDNRVLVTVLEVHASDK